MISDQEIKEWRADDLAFVNEQIQFFRAFVAPYLKREKGYWGGLKVEPIWQDPRPEDLALIKQVGEIIRLLEKERIKVIKENPYGKKAYDRWLERRQEA